MASLLPAVLALLRSIDVQFRQRVGVSVIVGGGPLPALPASILDTHAAAAVPIAAAAVPTAGSGRSLTRSQQQDSRAVRARSKALAAYAEEFFARVGVLAASIQALHALLTVCRCATPDVASEVQVCAVY